MQVNGHILMLVYNVFIEDFRGTVVTVRFIICSATRWRLPLLLGYMSEVGLLPLGQKKQQYTKEVSLFIICYLVTDLL